ncbi:MAG TPA: helix-turn-helix domain-containing protein [Deltaproteobacteria bacterium]|nr:helix-turn-helix domain-containing protein [Deltaproteobacteria bacterium]
MTRDGGLEQTRPTGRDRARGLVSSRASGRRVEARTYAPPKDLQDLVEGFWIGAWDLRGQPPHTTELIGDPAIHLCFEAGTGRIVGVWTHLWIRTLEGRGRVRAVKLRPGAARAFLPGPASAYSDRITPLEQVFDATRALIASVLEPTEERAFGALAAWLRAQRRDDEDVARAVKLVASLRGSGLNRVDALARRAGLSVRSLQRLFRDHVGASPKQVMRWVRLQEVALRVEAGEVIELASLAYQLGYADQAHLARDFRAVTGKTPRGFEASIDRLPGGPLQPGDRGPKPAP